MKPFDFLLSMVLLPVMKRAYTMCFVVSAILSACSGMESKRLDTSKSGAVAYVLDNPDIDEASGLAASSINKGMLWTHNDSGDQARIFLIDSLGRHRMTVHFDGIDNRDWEDIAVGPGPEEAKSYVYIGDIGDNFGRHQHKYIYRVEEPVLMNERIHVGEVDVITFSLPDGARDSEALMIDPRTKDIYIFTKREKAVNLYRLPFPQSTAESIVAELVLEGVPLTRVVGADWSSDGSAMLVKTYRRIHYYPLGDTILFQELLNPNPVRLPYAREPQGESIAFARNNKGYYTLGERPRGHKAELVFYNLDLGGENQ